MADGFRLGVTVPELNVDIEYDHVPITDQSFENALERAKNKKRLSVADGIELITTGTEKPGIDPERKAQVIDIANQRRAEIVGDEVTFVANLNNNITTVCDAGCLFCNFSTPSCEYQNADNPAGYTRTPAESRELVDTALDRGISEVTVASGLHPSLTLDEEHKEILRNTDKPVRYEPPNSYPDDPGTYAEQIDAISFDGLHVHGITPEEATHASRGTDWEYVDVYRRLADAGLDSVPGTAAEILVDEVRDVICSNKVSADDWMHAMEAAATAGLETTATILYGHIENAAHRVLHLQKIRRLQERTGSIREFIPLSFVHHNTPLYDQGYISEGATPAEDELMVAVSRLFLDNIDHIQASWVKHGDGRSLNLLTCGADDYMGTLLSEEITKRAGGVHGEYRTFKDYVDMITSIGRIPVERSTDYRTRRRIDPDDPPFGPTIGPRADGSPIL